MRTSQLGPVGEVSRLTLGGGGIGAVWGETSREEGVATLREALDLGITVLDAAPGYNHCEELIGEAFGGRLPAGITVTTKCGIGDVEPGTAYRRLRDSLEKSLATMQLDQVDLFFLHGHIAAQEPWAEGTPEADYTNHTTWAAYTDEVVDAFERLVSDGLTRHWALTGVDQPDAIIDAVGATPRPAAIQAVANLLDSPGNLTGRSSGARPREVIAAAREHGVGVMGIRAVQAGALTTGFDRELDPDSPEAADFRRAAPFRELCAQWGENPAVVAHRYALGMPGVDTVILGVKNRAELRELVAAEAAGPLEGDQVAAIDTLGLRTPSS